MRADECLFLVEKRSCSGHHRKDRFWPILLKNDFEEGLRATLIQDDHRTRKFDSRSHRPRFDCCADAPSPTFSTASVKFGHSAVSARCLVTGNRFASGPTATTRNISS